jgi:NAD(P)H-dependent FMN reductase
MITLICGTNRPKNVSQKFVNLYQTLLSKRNLECNTVAMENIPKDIAFSNDIIGTASGELKSILNEKIIPATKLVVVVPEYNGSFPGILKSFIDSVEPKHYQGKIIALVGISAGRAGNLRGMEHLTGIFHYLGAEVISTKVDIASVNSLLDENGMPNDEGVVRRLNRQIDHLLKY